MAKSLVAIVGDKVVQTLVSIIPNVHGVEAQES